MQQKTQKNTQTAKVYGNNIGIFRDVDNFWGFSPPHLPTSFLNRFISIASFTDLTTVFPTCEVRNKYMLSSGANLLQLYTPQTQ